MKYISNKTAFTLMEMLLVVLIVGILTAVALPMYQRAVYKSRFSKLMLPAKSLASANEAFFLGNGEYATAVASLDVGGNTAELPDGSTVDLQDTDDASFVRLANAEVPHARYVVYQQKSANFAGTTMCEAQGDDSLATWLCDKGLNGTIVEDAQGNNGANGWTAYLLTGTVGQNDQFGAGGNNDEPNNDVDEPADEPTAGLDAATQAKVDAVLASSMCAGNNHCIDNGDGTVSKCTGYATYDAQNNKCLPHGNSNEDFPYEYVYNENGKKILDKYCYATPSSGSQCKMRFEEIYDPATNQIVLEKQRWCQDGVVANTDELTCPDGKYDTTGDSGHKNYDYDMVTGIITYCTTFGPHGECNPS